MTIYAYIAAAVLAVAAWSASCWKAYELGRDHELATQAREDNAAAQTRLVASTAAAEAISKIEVRHVTIRQQADTVIREVPVYLDCRHDARVLRDINEARTGRAEPVGAGQLPAASAPDR
ncbi:MAG: hypothetical protein ABI605_10795 [Rhizobacter sp.]